MKTKLFLITALLAKVLTMSIPQAEENSVLLDGLNERSSCSTLNAQGRCSADCPCPKSGQCCSKYGYCGTEKKYCDNQMVTTKKTTTKKATSTKKSTTTTKSSSSTSTSTAGVVVYLPNYSLGSNIDLNSFDFSNIGVVNYCFFRLDSSGKAYTNNESIDIKKKSIYNLNHSIKSKYPKLRTILSFGGGSGSKNFGTVLKSSDRLKVAARSIAETAIEYGFDGVDIDWEFPKDDAECELLLELLKKIRSYLGDSRYLTLSSSATASKHRGYISSYNKYVNWFNVMTYNYAGSWNKYSGYNSPLYKPESDLNKQSSCHNTINDYQKEGVPSSKLVVGGAFNGRVWKVNSSSNNGYNQSGNTEIEGEPGNYSGVWTYRELRNQGILTAKKTPASPWVRTWHTDVKSPTLFNPKTKMYISYDDVDSMCERAKYAKNNKLSGVMVWELGQDYKRELIEELVSCYKKY